MKTLLRDRKIVYYANPDTVADQTDSFGNITGVPKITYGTPTKYERLSAANPSGLIKLEQFGLSTNYGTTFVTADMNCPIKEDTHLWINTLPYDGNGNLLPHDHVVKRVWKTINAIRVEVEEVSVS